MKHCNKTTKLDSEKFKMNEEVYSLQSEKLTGPCSKNDSGYTLTKQFWNTMDIPDWIFFLFLIDLYKGFVGKVLEKFNFFHNFLTFAERLS